MDWKAMWRGCAGFSTIAGVAILLLTGVAYAQADRARARRLFEQRDFLGAAAALERHLQSNPDGRDSRVLLGLWWHQFGFQLEGRTSNRDGIGARIRQPVNLLTVNSGYASSSLFGVHFGLGSSATAVDAEIIWPSGVRQQVRSILPDRVVTVREPAP